MVSEHYDLDLTPDSGTPLTVPVSQYDNGSRQITLTLYAGGAPYEVPAGSVATVQGTKKDRTGFQYGCTVDGSTVTFTIQTQMCIFAGRQEAEIVITNGDDVLGSANFCFAVEPAALKDDTIISDTDLALLEQMPQYVSDAEAWANGTRGGQAIPTTDEAYNKNAKHYAEQAGEHAQDAEDAASSSAASAASSATAAQSSEDARDDARAAATAAAASATAAATSATQAAASATAAATSETNAATSEAGAASAATTVATSVVTSALSGLTFGQDSSGRWGYKIGGADPVIPFNTGGGGSPIVGVWWLDGNTGGLTRYTLTPYAAGGPASVAATGILFSQGAVVTLHVHSLLNASGYTTLTAIGGSTSRSRNVGGHIDDEWDVSFTVGDGDVISITVSDTTSLSLMAWAEV